MTTEAIVFEDKQEAWVDEVEIPGLADYEIVYNTLMAKPIVKILVRPDVLVEIDK